MVNKYVLWIMAVLSVLVLSVSVSAVANIAVNKDVSKTSLGEGDEIVVTVTVENMGDEQLDGSFSDPIPVFAAISSGMESEGGESKTGFSREYSSQKLILDVGDVKTFKYKLSFPNIPPALIGRGIFLPGARVTDQTGLVYKSNPVGINFTGESEVNCNFNYICEPDISESYVSCPQDCRSGSLDDYCDQRVDRKCDPDCKTGLDPDCFVKQKGSCGNGVCERTENNITCPFDCLVIRVKTTTVKGIARAAQNIGYHKILTYLLLLLIIVGALLLLKKSKVRNEGVQVGRRESADSKTVKVLGARLKAGDDPKKLVAEGFDESLVSEASKSIWKK